ncbi:hypothetical protein IL306_000986 [Fusarium sp. DS 682]|nr:hypothetical protein IL306_000986 [Fusarium sp. DS 682]
MHQQAAGLRLALQPSVTQTPIPMPITTSVVDGTFVCTYKRNTEDAIRRMHEMVTNLIDMSPCWGRADGEYQRLQECCTGANTGLILPGSEALQLSPHDKPPNNIIVCTMDEATTIFNRGPPSLPVLVLGAYIENRLSIHEFLKILSIQPSLDVHDFASKEQQHLPRNLPSEVAINMFRQRHERDRHGVYRTALNQQEEKIWLVWPDIDMEMTKVPCKHLAESVPDGPFTTSGPIVIHIEEGSLLIQTPNLLHARVTVDTCLMTGTTHWHPAKMLDMLAGTQAAAEVVEVTNEGISTQFLPKVDRLLTLWDEASDVFMWPPEDHKDKCKEVRK